MLKHFQIQEEKKKKEQQSAAIQSGKDTEEETAKIEKEIEEAEKNGDVEKVMELLDKKEKVIIPPQVTTAGAPKVSGLAPKTTYIAEITNFSELSDEYKLPNMVLLSSIAAKSKGKLAIKGVKFVEKTKISGVRS